MIIVNNIKLPLDTDFKNLEEAVAKKLHINRRDIESAQLYRRSVDARRRDDVHFCCSALVQVHREDKILKKQRDASPFNIPKYRWPSVDKKPERRPIVVGFGPAGMFAALALAQAGLCPLIIERGQDVDTRTADVQNFFNGGSFKEDSNVQFGEGGAGTFSDGKLNTGIKDMRCRVVLETFVKFGAPDNILIDAKPHIGTDVLKNVVKNIRGEIISLGGEIRFGQRLEDIMVDENRISQITVNGKNMPCDRLLLCTGHSARDTFAMLRDRGIHMVRKPFAMGVRIEHLQSDINRALYGDFAEHPALGAADYKLSAHLGSGRGVYTFCMCPGGEVINASSANGCIAVNGMSNSHRNGANANSALLVGVNPEDIEGDDVLAGCDMQYRIERLAYDLCDGAVPITTVGSFLFRQQPKLGRVIPTVKPKTQFADFEKIYPPYIIAALKEGIERFDKKINGFASSDAILTAPETRSSSPVRIVRGEGGQSVSLRGLFPAGEGAGYAGGIMSAAVDGMRAAENLILSL